MARPNTTRRSVRVQAPSAPQSPNLDVVAPLDVRTPGPEGDPLWGLGQLLGLAVGVGSEVKKQRDDYEYKQGRADEMVGKADMERAAKSRKYSEGAYEVSILEAQQEAERVVAQKIADELDRSLPLDQQIDVIDGWMKSELGPLAADDKAKLILAPRYQEFINGVGGNLLTAEVEDRAKRAYEVVQRDAYDELKGTGTISWGEHWDRANTLTGDGAGSTAMLVGVVAQSMIDRAMAGDPNWKDSRDAIPTEIVGPDGTMIRGPMFTPKHADTITRAELQAQQAFDHAQRQQYAHTEFKARVNLDDMLAKDLPITEQTFKALGYTVGPDPGDTFSPATAAAYIQASQVKRARAEEDKAVMDGYLQARGRYGRWVDSVGLPGGPETMDKGQKAYDGWVQTVMLGGGRQLEELGGSALVKDQELVNDVVALSAQEGFAYGPLKRTLNEVNQAAPGDLTARIEAYKIAKAKGVASQYVADDTALLYEVAIGAQEAGESPEGVTERVRSMGDKSTAQYVSDQVGKLKVRKSGFEIPTGNGFFSFGPRAVNSTKTMNPGYLANKYEQLVMMGLSRELPLDKAEEFAEQRLAESHMALAIGKGWFVLPTSAVPDPRTATEALDWYVEDQLPKLREKLKLPEDRELTLQPRYDVNGRAVEIEVLDGAFRVGPAFHLNGLINLYRTRIAPPAAADKAAKAREEAVQTSKDTQAERAARDERARIRGMSGP